ncbi:phospholipase D-like domain-containing protein [Termitidicoccus mucosus]|uniref:Cardiolipin synthase n=1 Tax=Termitidicoccus mucosus TaxID=1184151 RepID=A0A178IKM2_9BACT|nr:cardiolipin synthase [Opitutaceae bacterium TSB47]
MEFLRSIFSHPWLPHVLAVSGFVFAVFLIARLFAEKKQPSNTVAWLLVIVLIPYVGVPLYLMFGGRKLRRLMARKSRLVLVHGGLDLVRVSPSVSQVINTTNALGASPPVGGNALRLITTGEEAFALMEENIRHARHSIHITTFILGRDDTGRRLVELLAERARAGVKVRLLLDAVGCVFSSRGFVDPIRRAGGEVQRFMPVFSLVPRRSANLRNHRKIAVFDQHTAIVGGHNLAEEYMGPLYNKKRWSDFGAVVAGPAAVLLNEVFLADWAFASGKPLEALHNEEAEAGEPVRVEGDSALQVVASGPDAKGDPLYEGLIAMIQDARESIYVITPYFIPDEVLWRSLMVKARAGVRVVLVLPERSNHPITDYARRFYTRELRGAGARVMHYGAGMLHSKAVIVDERVGLIGSANFDLRSLLVNFEIGVFVYSRADVRKMGAWVATLLASSTELKQDRPRRFPFFSGLLEDLCRLLAPLL